MPYSVISHERTNNKTIHKSYIKRRTYKIFRIKKLDFMSYNKIQDIYIHRIKKTTKHNSRNKEYKIIDNEINLNSTETMKVLDKFNNQKVDDYKKNESQNT